MKNCLTKQFGLNSDTQIFAEVEIINNSSIFLGLDVKWSVKHQLSMMGAWRQNLLLKWS